jgi:hypothetical protein
VKTVALEDGGVYKLMIGLISICGEINQEKPSDQ